MFVKSDLLYFVEYLLCDYDLNMDYYSQLRAIVSKYEGRPEVPIEESSADFKKMIELRLIYLLQLGFDIDSAGELVKRDVMDSLESVCPTK